MIQISDQGWRASSPAVGGHRQQHGTLQRGRPHLRRAGCAVLIGAVLIAGCAGRQPAPAAATPRRGPRRAGPAAAARPLARVPRPDCAGPASAAAASCTARADAGTVPGGPLSSAARCAPLATPSPARQLAASQFPAAAWQQMRREHLVSLVRVRAVTRPGGAPAPAGPVACLRVYATRVTVTTAGRATASDGTTLQLTRTGGRRLAVAVLSW
jgi:hypothetical protein